MTIQKTVVVQKFRELLEQQLEGARHALNKTQEGAREAPGSNVTHSDTSKSRLSDVAVGLQRRVADIDAALAALRYPVSPVSVATIGALVSVRDTEGDSVTHYYIVRYAGGNIVEVDGVNIMSISAGAPLGRMLMNKEEGDDFRHQGKTLEIVSVA